MAYTPPGLQNLSGLQSYEANKSYLAGEAPLVSPSGGEYGGGADPAGGGATPTSVGAQAQPSVSQNPDSRGEQAGFTSSLFDRTQTQTAPGVFDPLQKGIAATTQELQGLGADFRGGLPQTRTWEGVGAKGTLDAAIQPGGSMEPAQGLLNSKYEGPMGLDSNAIGGFQNQQQQLAAQAKALTTGSGLQNILQLGAPGITPGEARFEAGNTIAQPGYQAQAMQLKGQADAITAVMQREMESASSEAQKRAAGEKAIADRSRGYLETRRGDLSGGLDKAVSDAKAGQAETTALWQKIMGTGDTSILPEELRSQFEGTDIQTRRKLAEQEWARVMGQYPELAQYDPLNLKISGRGHERYTEPGGSVNDPYFSGDMADWGPLQERQRALESKFSPGTKASAQGYQPYGETGKYSDVAPMYDYENAVGGGAPDQPWETPDVRGYLELDYGLDPNRSNISTGEQREVFNRINTLLGEAERLEASGEEWRAAKIMGDVDAFISEEERRLEKSKAEVGEKADDWIRVVSKARNRYNDSQGGLAGAIGPTLGMASPALDFATGPV